MRLTLNMKFAVRVLLFFYRVYFNSIGLFNLNHTARLLISIFSHPRKRVIRKKEIEILSEAKETEIRVDNLDLKLYQWGTGEKTALLIHGWESNAGSLGAFVKPLLSEGFKVLAFDAPAHGVSPGKKSNLIYYKESVKRIIEDYGVPAICIGHSLGANTIILAAFELKVVFEKVILISPLNRLMSVFEMYKEILWLPQHVFEAFLNRFGNETDYELENLYFHELAEKSLIKKALILHDVNDQVTAFQDAEELANNWTCARLEGIEKSGHYSILWKDEVQTFALSFSQE